MDKAFCVTCKNKNTVNQTYNRLVTESCGHIKCMNCLLLEKSGCVACATVNDNIDVVGNQEKELTNKICLEDKRQPECEDLSKKKKLDTSHILIETDSRGGLYYQCTVCKKKFNSKTHVAYHAYCNGQKKPFHCSECKKSFATQSHYKYHMRVHLNEKKYSCDLCQMSFVQFSKLKRHKLKHTKEKKFQCHQCGKGFNNSSALRKHGLTHTQERPYTCDICGQKLRDSSNYRKHLEKHKATSWSCSVCHHQCETRGGLEEHTRVHTGNTKAIPISKRKYQCPRCPHSFHARIDLKRHLGVHSDSKPFRCKICNRRFRRKDNIERHIRNTHQNTEPAAAMDCDETALERITNGQTATQELTGRAYEICEKTKLEICNPLPPLTTEDIEKHIDVTTDKTEATDETVPTDVTDKTVIDKLSIIEANNARQSVIVEKRNTENAQVPSPVNEYVHKIRKAVISLPPIDPVKFQSVKRGFLPDACTVEPIKNVELYKKILCEKVDKETNEVMQSPKMHWRRKMEQDTN
ncbi:zinc finger protein 558 [Leptidea sinapis]|uniref:zinc finger protein 558 n=1 Tax=Leptidea sinapis TaxID=189913 RepID=UPI00213E67AB|nr:zinc finger protein 558 [Leptidea sinapis]